MSGLPEADDHPREDAQEGRRPYEQIIIPEPHEPPIIIGGGSLYIELAGNKTLNEPVPNHARPRPFAHGFAGGGEATVQALEFVHVLTQHRAQNGIISFSSHRVDPALDCELQIFLSQRVGHTNVFQPVDAAEPQLVVAGDPFRLEVDKQLRGPEVQPKNHNPLRYDHPGYARRFRIERWRVVSAAGAVVNPGATGDDSYWFALTFFHPHKEEAKPADAPTATASRGESLPAGARVP